MEEPMNKQDVQSAGSRSSGSSGVGDRIGAAASAALSQASDVAQDAGAKARAAASDAANHVSGQVKEMLDRQIGAGASIAGHFASSARRAADDLASESPFVAGMVRTFADRVDDHARGFRDSSVEELVRAASDFTRRQPALVFGLAALAGFFMFRTVKSTPSVTAPPIQPSGPHEGSGYRRTG
jgi:ElaB/YqjD/DUF883 family membrane-anchored ribosome-binding protein